jgi:hypothetical protein
MKEPKKIFITKSGIEDLNRGFITDVSIYIGDNDSEYISVNILREWIKENKIKVFPIDVVKINELLKFIKDETT